MKKWKVSIMTNKKSNLLTPVWLYCIDSHKTIIKESAPYTLLIRLQVHFLVKREIVYYIRDWLKVSLTDISCPSLIQVFSWIQVSQAMSGEPTDCLWPWIHNWLGVIWDVSGESSMSKASDDNLKNWSCYLPSDSDSQDIKISGIKISKFLQMPQSLA